MRHIQVIRARTREPEPCSVSLELYQSPVILYSQYSDEDDGSAGPTHLGLAVTVSLDGRRRIGGVTLVRQVLIRRKIPQTKQWARWEPLQQEQIQVVGERTVCGKQRYVRAESPVADGQVRNMPVSSPSSPRVPTDPSRPGGPPHHCRRS